MLHRTQLLCCHRAASRLPQQRSRSVCMTFGRLNALLAPHSPAHMPLCRCPRSLHHAAAPLVQPSAKPTSIATRLAFLAGGCSHAAAARPRQPRPHAICTLAQGGCTRLAAFALRASAHFTQPALLASRRLQPAATRRGSPTQSEPATARHKRRISAVRAQRTRAFALQVTPHRHTRQSPACPNPAHTCICLQHARECLNGELHAVARCMLRATANSNTTRRCL